ncbi:hypothetical protein SpCBS45565_g07208 [Spizellomyces sp. 'palustris']|nr:hypothetical protein SpCBS45565_g07208 [Spizellomyces sp. 'palustris']
MSVQDTTSESTLFGIAFCICVSTLVALGSNLLGPYFEEKHRLFEQAREFEMTRKRISADAEKKNKKPAEQVSSFSINDDDDKTLTRLRNRVMHLEREKEALGDEIIRLRRKDSMARIELKVYKEEAKNVQAGMQREMSILRDMIRDYRNGKNPGVCCTALDEKIVNGPPISAEAPGAFDRLAKLDNFDRTKLVHSFGQTVQVNKVPDVAA